jgi:hypothetical protein
MARYPTFTRSAQISANIVTPPNIDQAGLREQVKGARRLSENAERVQNFAFKEAEKRAKVSGTRAGSEDPSGTLARFGGERPEYGFEAQAAFDAAVGLASVEIETQARLAMRETLFKYQKNKGDPQDLSQELEDIREGFASSVDDLDPLSAAKIRSKLSSAGQGLFLDYSADFLKEQQRQREATGITLYSTTENEASIVGRQTGTDDSLAALIARYADSATGLGINPKVIANDIEKLKDNFHISRVRGLFASTPDKQNFIDQFEKDLDKGTGLARGLSEGSKFTLGRQIQSELNVELADQRRQAQQAKINLNADIAAINQDIKQSNRTLIQGYKQGDEKVNSIVERAIKTSNPELIRNAEELKKNIALIERHRGSSPSQINATANALKKEYELDSDIDPYERNTLNLLSNIAAKANTVLTGDVKNIASTVVDLNKTMLSGLKIGEEQLSKVEEKANKTKDAVLIASVKNLKKNNDLLKLWSTLPVVEQKKRLKLEIEKAQADDNIDQFERSTIDLFRKITGISERESSKNIKGDISELKKTITAGENPGLQAIESIVAASEKNGDPELIAEAKALRQNMTIASIIRSGSPRDIEDLLAKTQQNFRKDGVINQYERDRIIMLQNAAKNTTASVKKNLAQHYVNVVEPLVPLDLSNPESLIDRQKKMDAFAIKMGLAEPASYFTESELTALKSIYDDADTTNGQKIELFAQIFEGFGDKSPAVLNQIAKNNPSAAQIGAMLYVGGDRDLAHTIMTGQAILNTPGRLKGTEAKIDQDTKTVFSIQLRSVLGTSYEDDFGPILSSVHAAYMGLAAAGTPVVLTEPDQVLKLISRVMGSTEIDGVQHGGVTEYNGKLLMIPSSISTDDDAPNSLVSLFKGNPIAKQSNQYRSKNRTLKQNKSDPFLLPEGVGITSDELKSLGYEIFDNRNKSKKPVPIDQEFRDEITLQNFGENKVILTMGDSGQMFEDKSGNPIVIDLNDLIGLRTGEGF